MVESGRRACAVEIVDWRVYRYRLALAPPLRLKGATLTERRGLILRLTDIRGHEGFGEVAPLPGFSREDEAQALEQLEHCCRALVGVVPLGKGWRRWRGEYDHFYRQLPDTDGLIGPSVRTGLELALVELFSQYPGAGLARFFNPSTRPGPAPLCPLLEGSAEQVIAKARRIAMTGTASPIKLKVGQRPPEQDAELLWELLEILGSGTRFRLDANRQWGFDQAMDFAARAPRESIAYVEEPMANLEGSRRFCAACGIGLALDETLQAPEWKPEPFPELAALVVKPTLCGGLERTLTLIRWAAPCTVPVIISSSFESSLGVGQLARLASGLTPGQPAGLDTLGAFTQDLIRPAPYWLSSSPPKPVISLQSLESPWRYLPAF